MNGRLRVLLLFLVAAVASFALLHGLTAPWSWIALLWAVTLVAAMRWSRPTALKLALLNLAAVAATLAALEVWAGSRRTSPPSYEPASYRRDDVLGMSPRPNSTVRSVRRVDGTVAFDVTYTFGPNGLRVMPIGGGAAPDACVLFFGDSFIFGEGLEDDQTLPYQVAMLGKGRLEVYNFGFHGYGPQQMLAALEQGRVAGAITCRPTHVILESIPDHVARAAGLAPWASHYPRYRMEPDGSVRHDGRFDDGARAAGDGLRMAVREQLAKSSLFRWIAARQRRLTAGDFQLYVGIVRQARRDLQAAYPGSEFVVLYWGAPGTQAASALQAEGIPIRFAERILPSYAEDPAAYTIPLDGHPNAKANELLAQHVLDSIIRPSLTR
jgi:hypothetical protein